MILADLGGLVGQVDIVVGDLVKDNSFLYSEEINIKDWVSGLVIGGSRSHMADHSSYPALVT